MGRTHRYTEKELVLMAKRCLHNKPHNDTVVAIMLDQAADTERRLEEVMSKFGPNFDWIAYEIVNYIKTGKVNGGNEYMPKNKVEVTAKDVAKGAIALLEDVMKEYLDFMGHVPAKYVPVANLTGFHTFKERKDEIEKAFRHIKG